MVRTQVQLTQALAAKLRRMAKRDKVSMAEVIRRVLETAPETEVLPDREELKRRALSAVGCADFGAPDIARRHDEYWAEDLADEHLH
jgi:metal-responsive CopG/Arc/MetJ family transcriptional regulator